MKITIGKGGILNAVAIASTFTPKEGDFVGKIVLVGIEGRIEVRATDAIQTVIIRDIDFVCSDLTVNSFDSFSIDGKKLLATLKSAKTDEVAISFNDGHILLCSGKSKIKIETLVKTQEIDIQTGSGNIIDIGSHLGHMDQMLHAVDQNNPKFELNGVLLQIKDNMFSIVGTDTRRIACISSPVTADDSDIIVPREAVKTIISLFSETDTTAEISETILTVTAPNMSYSTRLISGKYPDWERIIPASSEKSITLNRLNLSDLIKDASIFDPSITIRIKNGKIKITDSEKNTEVVDTISDTETNLFFTIDSKFLLDFLGSFREEDVTIDFNAKNLPVSFIANEVYKEIIMPITTGDEEEEDIDTEAHIDDGDVQDAA